MGQKPHGESCCTANVHIIGLTPKGEKLLSIRIWEEEEELQTPSNIFFLFIHETKNIPKFNRTLQVYWTLEMFSLRNALTCLTLGKTTSGTVVTSEQLLLQEQAQLGSTCRKKGVAKWQKNGHVDVNSNYSTTASAVQKILMLPVLPLNLLVDAHGIHLKIQVTSFLRHTH